MYNNSDYAENKKQKAADKLPSIQAENQTNIAVQEPTSSFISPIKKAQAPTETKKS